MPGAFQENSDKVGDREHSRIIKGCRLTASDPPDDRVYVAAGMWVFKGAQHGKIRTEHVFDLTDGDGLALMSEESFWALLELGNSGVMVTKGPKGVTPQRPAQSLGELVLGWVKVEHDPSGIPVIDAVDLDVRLRYDRFHLEPGPGLAATLHPGQAISSTAWLYRAITTPLVLEAGVSNYVWLLPTGRPLVTSAVAAPDP